MALIQQTHLGIMEEHPIAEMQDCRVDLTQGMTHCLKEEHQMREINMKENWNLPSKNSIVKMEDTIEVDTG